VSAQIVGGDDDDDDDGRCLRGGGSSSIRRIDTSNRPSAEARALRFGPAPIDRPPLSHILSLIRSVRECVRVASKEKKSA
jgi:hypothetical protein